MNEVLRSLTGASAVGLTTATLYWLAPSDETAEIGIGLQNTGSRSVSCTAPGWAILLQSNAALVPGVTKDRFSRVT